MDFVFSTKMDKKAVQNCVKYLNAPTDMKNYCYNKYVQKCYPITYLIRKVLAATTILAFGNYASEKDKSDATEYILKNHYFEDDLFYNVNSGAPWGCGLSLVDVHIDFGNKLADLLDGLNIGLEGGCLEVDGELDSNSELDDYINKYVNIGAIAIMVRGGFVNLLKAYLSTGIDISNWKKELFEGLNDCDNKLSLELIK